MVRERVTRSLTWKALVAGAAAVWVVWPLTVAMVCGRPVARSGHRVVLRRSRPAARVLLLGDSSALGAGSSAPRLSVAGRLATAHPDWSIGNLARNGSRTVDVARVLVRLARRLHKYGPAAPYEAVVIHTGANDALRFLREGPLAVALAVALTAANGIARHTVLVTGGSLALAPAFPPPWSWLFGWRGRRVRDLFHAIAWEAGVQYVDLHYDDDTDPTVGQAARRLAADGLHPSDADYALWFESIDAVLRARIPVRAGGGTVRTITVGPTAASVIVATAR